MRTKSGLVRGWESDKTSIKRENLRHLDNLSDDQVEAYFQNLNSSRVSRKINPEVLTEVSRKYIDLFLIWLSGRGRSRHTISQHRTNLHTAALYFDRQGTLSHWPRYSVKLRVYLKERGLSENHINKIQMSTGQLWKYLRKHERIVEGPIDFDETVGHAKSKDTPLKRHLTPQEVLEWCRACKVLHVRLMALVGYFASLRPQETFAQTETDFIGGAEALTFECSKVMSSIGMFNGFTIDVLKQRGVRLGEIGDPKKHSSGVVSVFNREAALLIVDTIRGVRALNLAKARGDVELAVSRVKSAKPYRRARAEKAVNKTDKALEVAEGGVLFQNGNRLYEGLWAAKGLEEVTLKDLRRASGYWLANYTVIKLESLHLHMRHKDIQTTSLYFRRAKEKPTSRTLDIL